MDATVSKNCLLCGSSKKDTVFEAQLPESLDERTLHYTYNSNTTSNTWRYRVVRCKECGHKYPDPVYSQETLEKSYLGQDHDNEFGIDRKILLKTHEGYGRIVEPFLPADRRLQIDIGCDTGLFLQATRRLGFKRAVGIEPSVESAKRAAQVSGIEVMQKIFASSDFAGESVNFASLIHVLDHLVDPRKVIRELRPTLSKDGIVLGVVHNIESVISKISGSSWPPLGLLHMDYFAPDSLRRLYEVEGYNVLAVVGTKNYFPLSHLIRMTPFLTPKLRGALIQTVERRPLKSMVLGLMLGNIAVVARRS
jgi:2-polyprenyl-3-methyl-5-hydroxy-6-metoxy-1,4-benzoquinol methylase